MQQAQNIELVIAYFENAVANETNPIFDEFDETETDFEYAVVANDGENIAQVNLNYFKGLRGLTELNAKQTDLLEYALEIVLGDE